MSVPRPPNSLGDCLRFCREVWDYLCSTEDIQSADTLLHRTTRGTARSAIAALGSIGESGTLQFQGQWDASTDYSAGDIVRRSDPAAYEEGKTGTYIAQHDIDHTTAIEPGEDVAETDWALVSPDGTGYFVFTNYADLSKKIWVSYSGEAEGTGLRPIIRLQSNASDKTADGCIDLDVNLCVDSGGSVFHRIYPQMLITCEEDGPKARMFLCSDAFDIPVPP